MHQGECTLPLRKQKTKGRTDLNERLAHHLVGLEWSASQEGKKIHQSS